MTEINEQKELLESWDFLEEELQVEKEALKDTLRLSVESSLKTVFQALNGVDCNLDDILSESSNSQSGALFDLTEWLKDEMHVYSNHTNRVSGFIHVPTKNWRFLNCMVFPPTFRKLFQDH